MYDRLCKWLAHSASTILHRQFVDIHIDEIDPILKSPKQWISGVQRLLAEGAKLLAAEYDGRYVLAGCIALRSSSEAIGVNFSDEADLLREFDVTPPSIYMFIKNSEPWKNDKLNFVDIDKRFHFCDYPYMEIMHLEYQDPTEVEFRRSLWLVLPDDVDGQAV